MSELGFLLTSDRVQGYISESEGRKWTVSTWESKDFLRVISRTPIPLPFNRPKWQAVTSTENWAITAVDEFGQIWKGRTPGVGMYTKLRISIADTIQNQKRNGKSVTRKLPWTPGRIKKRLIEARSLLHEPSEFTPGIWSKHEPQFLYSNDQMARLFWKINETTGSVGSVSIELASQDDKGFWVWPS